MRVMLAAGAACMLAVSIAAAQQPGGDVDSTVHRIGLRVEEYYSHAQSIVARETVRIERQRSDMVTEGHVRRLVYDLRVDWDPIGADGVQPEAKIVRQLVSVDGRPPKKGDEDACMDPEPVSPEPMMMLLPSKREEYVFTLGNPARTDGRRALTVNYKSRARGKAEIKWKEHCVSVSLPGWSRGRIWIDPATHDVLRLDEELTGMFEFPVPRDQQDIAGGPTTLAVERSDSSIRYQAVTFREPDEILMLPRSVETTSLWRNAPLPRVRVTQSFTDYKRFIGDSHLIPAGP